MFGGRWSSGTRNMPAGVTWTSGAADPVDGPAGTGAGSAGKGSEYTNLTSGVKFTNLGTMASPEWHGGVLT